MKKVTKDYATISITDLAQKLVHKNKLIVFYRSGDNKTGLPVFLKTNGASWYFMSPVNHYNYTFESYSCIETLAMASGSRMLYVVEEHEYHELFVI